MCRVLSYLGSPLLTEEILYKPDNSFIKQSYHPIYMPELLNLAGFGLVAWENTSSNPKKPFIYKTPGLPFYDENLHNLAGKISPHCLLAHIRGVPYTDRQIVSTQNVHPFLFEGTNVAFAHNGSLRDFLKMKYDLLEYIDPEFRSKIQGTTDSEWMYAVFISQLKNHLENYKPQDISKAIIETLKIVQEVREKNNIQTNSPVNLFITNGEYIAATRFVYDYGWFPSKTTESLHVSYHSLWYTYGENFGYYDNEYRMQEGENKSSIIIASEPLTTDTTTWIEVPEYTLIIAMREKNHIKIISQDIDI